MTALTDTGRQTVADLAARYGVSQDAVITLARALAQSGGSQAQFSHPDLGGMGQWSQGGMTMISDMFNNGLKATVDGLCGELSGHVRQGDLFARAAAMPSSFQSQQQSSGGYGATSYMVSGGSDWPSELGSPSSVGTQNDLRYAVFPQTRRLAISHGGRTTIYDTGDHAIGGVSQQQSGDQSLTFTSQYGLVRVADLPVVTPGTPDAEPAPVAVAESAPDSLPETTPQQEAAPDRSLDQPSQATAWSPAPPARSADPSDAIFATLERLADLHKKGVLTDSEFDAKKAELLSRL
jgi:hypothetical protein